MKPVKRYGIADAKGRLVETYHPWPMLTESKWKAEGWLKHPSYRSFHIVRVEIKELKPARRGGR